MIYFISDTHFGHENIIKYSNRPFSSREEMDLFMIQRWNAIVTKDDDIYHLGDFCMGGYKQAIRYLSMLSGRIHFVTSQTHHDNRWLDGFSGQIFITNVDVEYGIKILKQKDPYPSKIVLCHFPISVWEDKHYGSWHLHGHIHESYTPGQFSMNVSVENTDYAPVSIDDVLAHMINKGWTKDWSEFGVDR